MKNSKQIGEWSRGYILHMTDALNWYTLEEHVETSI